MLSMTGYGTGRCELGRGALVIEARSVNHRFLDIRVRLPVELIDHAATADGVARSTLERGRVEITGRIEGPHGGEARLDRARARSAFEQLCELRDELRPDEPVPLSLLGCVPDLFTVQGTPDPAETREAVARATRRACERLVEMRAQEGRRLADDLARRLERIVEHAHLIHARAPGLVEAHRSKLRERIQRLLHDTGTPLDPGRLEHEIAVFADRADVAEELTRLESHCDQLRSLLAPDDRKPVGRRLDFLLQEMAREANTVGAKIGDPDITLHVVDLKAELERVREQVQNVL